MEKIIEQITRYHNACLLCLCLAALLFTMTLIVYVRWGIYETIAFFVRKYGKNHCKRKNDKEETHEERFQLVTEKICNHDNTVRLYWDEQLWE